MRTPSKVDIVIPIYNEEQELAASIQTLLDFVKNMPGYEFTITIANNGSTDRSQEIAADLSRRFEPVRVLNIGEKGRGRALRKAWLESDAEYLTYMDVDLSTNLEAFPVLVAALHAGYDIVIGSRLFRASRTVRSLKREVISRGYNLLLKLFFRAGFRDAQCGFKGIRRDVARKLIPFVENNQWFFDSELLILGEATRHRIMEVPVGWIEDLDSRVALVRTITDDLKGILRVRKNLGRMVKRVGA
jgi:glycosyltransferase involved in cell wall biosynthesis